MAEPQKGESTTFKESFHPASGVLTIQSIDGGAKDLIDNPGKHNAFLGISLGKDFFSKKHIKMYFDWAMSNCNKFVLLIDDWEEQHNFRVLKGLDPEISLQKAVAIGKEKETSFAKVLSTYSEEQKKRCTIIRSSELFQNSQDEKIHEINKKLIDAFSHDGHFKEAVIGQVHKNIGAKITEWQERYNIPKESDKYKQAVGDILPRYLLEEFAVTIYLREHMGFPIEVYPAEAMDVFRDMYKGKYSKFTQGLISQDKYGYINLGIAES